MGNQGIMGKGADQPERALQAGVEVASDLLGSRWRGPENPIRYSISSLFIYQAMSPLLR